MPISRALQAVFLPWPLGVLRLVALLLLVGQLLVTGLIQRPDLLNPAQIGSDPSNYFAAGQRLNAGHSLYGPLHPDDVSVPGYPEVFPAPILSPPLLAVAWRPLALLPGPLSMDLWWFGGVALLTELVLAFSVAGRPRNIVILGTVLTLGLPLTLLTTGRYPYLGVNSPVSTAALSGNVNPYLVGLFALTWWASCRDRPWLAGASAALATALKLGPIVLLWWFITRRSWRSAGAFIVVGLTLGLVGVLLAGLQANLDFVHLALGGDVEPTQLSVPGMLDLLPGALPSISRYGTMIATVVGLAAILLLRNEPRAAFAAAILTTIYCSPVVLDGNFALLVALAAPWVLPPGTRRATATLADERSAKDVSVDEAPETTVTCTLPGADVTRSVARFARLAVTFRGGTGLRRQIRSAPRRRVQESASTGFRR